MQDEPMIDDWRYRRGFDDAKRSVRAEMDVAIKALQQQLAAAREALQAAEANAARYLLIAKRWQHQKTSESELLLMTLGLEGDVTGQLDDIIDTTLQRDLQP